MKNNLEYYQHFTDSHNHPKFKMFRVKYGWAGDDLPADGRQLALFRSMDAVYRKVK